MATIFHGHQFFFFKYKIAQRLFVENKNPILVDFNNNISMIQYHHLPKKNWEIVFLFTIYNTTTTSKLSLPRYSVAGLSSKSLMIKSLCGGAEKTYSLSEKSESL